MRLPFIEVSNITHSLLVVKLPFTEMCSDAYILLVIGKGVMKLPVTEVQISLTLCWS